MSALEAYAARSREYAEALGNIDVMAPQDRRTIERWAAGVHGPLLDLGCGPGHWTAHLASLGHDVRGADPVPEFLEIARRAHPGVDFRCDSFAGLMEQPDAWGGILSWYSLIHIEPEQVPAVLAGVHDALRPTGRLLLGFFDGPRQEMFEHAVAPACLWPTAQMARLLESAGLEVLEVGRRHDPGARPHAAVSARRR